MDKILAPIKQRILFFIDSQGFTKKHFFEKLKISASNFRSNGLYSEIGGDVIAKILSEHKELNTEWLLTGNGQMLKSNSLDGIIINKQEDIQEVQEELTKAWKKYGEAMEDLMSSKDTIASLKAINKDLEHQNHELQKEVEELKKAQLPKGDYRHSVKNGNE